MLQPHFRFALPLVTVGFVLSGMAHASNQLYMPSSTSTTTGGLTNEQLSSSGRYNPAATYLNTNRYRTLLLDSSGSIDVRGLGSLIETVDDLEREGDEFQTLLDRFQDDDDDDVSAGDVLDQVETLEDALDRNVARMANQLSVKPGVMASIPATPLQAQVPIVDGVFSFGASYLVMGRGTALHSAITFNIDESTIEDSEEDFDPSDFLNTASSFYIKTGRAWNFDLSYAQPIPGAEFGGLETIVGGRATLIAADVQKQLYPLKQLISEATTDDGDLDAYFTMIQDDLEQGLREGDLQFTAALDLGVILQGSNAHVGLTGYNLNSPTIEYNTVGVNCLDIEDTMKQNACFHADYFDSIGAITAEESHVMHPRFTVDAGYHVLNNQVAIGGAYDLNPGTDMFGDQSQKISTALLLQPRRWYAPKFRFGYQKDLLDPAPTTLAAGLSLFNVLQFDQSVTAEFGNLFSDDDVTQANAFRGASSTLSFNLSF